MVDWIIGAFRPVAEWVDGRAGCKDHVKRWQEVSRCASVGWGAEASAGHRDLTESVYDREEQLKRWRELPAAWNTFVEKLTSALATSRSAPKKPLLVLPIDDCDLQVARVHEVFHAVRLLHHPRVAFVLTGDLEHAEDIERLHAWGEMQGAAKGIPSGDGDLHLELSRDLVEWAWWLARSRTEKAVPLGHRIDLRLLSLGEALSWDDNWLAKRLATSPPSGEWRGGLRVASDLGGHLARWPEEQGRRLVRIRALVQSRALAEAGSTRTPPRSSAVEDLMYLVHEAQGEVIGSGPPPVIRTRARAARVISHPVSRAGAVVLAGVPEYEQEEGGRRRRWVRARPTSLLLHEISRFSRHGWQAEDFFSGPHVVWSWWRGERADAFLWWPLPVLPESVVECEELYAAWRRILPGNVTTVEALAYQFIRLCLWSCGIEQSENGVPHPGVEDWSALLEDAWEAREAATGARRRVLDRFLLVDLPLLGAPEWGIDVQVREHILLHLLRRTEAEFGREAVVARLVEARRSAVREGLRQAAAVGSAGLPEEMAGNLRTADTAKDREVEVRAALSPGQDVWDLVVRLSPWLQSANREIQELLEPLARPGADGRPMLAYRTLLDLATNPFCVMKLDEHLRGGRPARWATALRRLVVVASDDPRAVVRALWETLLEAGRPGSPGSRDPNGLLRMVATPTGVRIANAGALSLRRNEPPGLGSLSGSMEAVEWLETDELYMVTWSVDGIQPLVGALREAGVVALLLLVQAVLADHGYSVDGLSLDDAWGEGVRGAFGVGLPRLPKLPAWIDLDLIHRDLRLQRSASFQGSGSTWESSGERWAAASLLLSVSLRSAGERHPPRAENLVVDEDLIASRLAPAVEKALQGCPPFADWWRTHRTKLVRWIGLNADEALPPGAPYRGARAPRSSKAPT